MNIFFIDPNPRTSAQAMSNKHIVKQILESAQLLSGAHLILDGDDATHHDELYRLTHKNHPSAIWTREAVENYNWLYEHFRALCDEYTIRYGKTHLTETKLASILSDPPKRIPARRMTPIRLAISNTDYHRADPFESYRAYYEAEKFFVPQDSIRYYNIIGGKE